MQINEELHDRIKIRDLLESWVIWRDAGDWDRLAGLWHDEGWMMTTWSRAPAVEFIARSRQAFDRGLSALHTLGGSSIDIVADRAVAQTKMMITQRAEVHSVIVDVSCQGRFVDALEKRDGRWGLVLRQPVYELDRMSPVDPGASVVLDKDLLASFPEGYRYLGYLQTQQGMDVYRSMPGTRGPEIERLSAQLASWLSRDVDLRLQPTADAAA